MSLLIGCVLFALFGALLASFFCECAVAAWDSFKSGLYAEGLAGVLCITIILYVLFGSLK